MSLSVISVPPATGQQPVGVLVILHGWGGNAQELASLAPFLNLSNYLLLFPNAPFSHPQVSGGKMWYNLARTGYSQQDYQDLAESQRLLREWLNSLEDSTGIPLSRTILGGFSQGGAMTLDVGLSLPLAGLVVMSGYLHPISQQIGKIPPILIVHGRQDTIVPLSAAWKARDTLVGLGASVQYQEFDMGHEIRPQAVEVIRSFVTRSS